MSAAILIAALVGLAAALEAFRHTAIGHSLGWKQRTVLRIVEAGVNHVAREKGLDALKAEQGGKLTPAQGLEAKREAVGNIIAHAEAVDKERPWYQPAVAPGLQADRVALGQKIEVAVQERKRRARVDHRGQPVR